MTAAPALPPTPPETASATNSHASRRASLEAMLTHAEAKLVQLQPLAASLLLVRARALDALGRDAEARVAYIDLLRLDKRNFDGLTGLAAVLLRAGHRGHAKNLLARAVRERPDSAAAQANFATVLSDTDPDAAIVAYERALELDPDNVPANGGLAALLIRAGHFERARHHGRIAFRRHFDAWPFRGTGRPVSVLWVQSALGGNVPIEGILDDKVFHRRVIAVEFFEPGDGLPEHDVVFNALGDAERCGASLDAVAQVLGMTSAPVINPPSVVRPTSRRENAGRLSRIADVVTPKVSEWSRASLAAPNAAQALAEAGFTWPLLLRSPGFHTGENFVKVDAPEGLAGALAALPGESLLALQFLDTRSRDGQFRKYRVMTVDGRLYPLHLAVSQRWKVHYFSSDMAARADCRREEQGFLDDMPGVIGPRAMRSLEAIRETLGLDYGGIDFTLDGEGRVVLFEANATMIIVEPPQDPMWAYRLAPVERARRAVVDMLVRRAGRPVEDAPSSVKPA